MRRKLHDAGACRAMAADVERESDRLLVDLVGAATARTTSSEKLNSPLSNPAESPPNGSGRSIRSAPCCRCDMGWLLAMPPGRALQLDGAEVDPLRPPCGRATCESVERGTPRPSTSSIHALLHAITQMGLLRHRAQDDQEVRASEAQGHQGGVVQVHAQSHRRPELG